MYVCNLRPLFIVCFSLFCVLQMSISKNLCRLHRCRFLIYTVLRKKCSFLLITFPCLKTGSSWRAYVNFEVFFFFFKRILYRPYPLPTISILSIWPAACPIFSLFNRDRVTSPFRPYLCPLFPRILWPKFWFIGTPHPPEALVSKNWID